MKRVRTITFNSFSLESDGESPALERLFELFRNKPFSDENGFGFSKIRVDSNKIAAVLLKRSNTYVQEYDSKKEEVVKKQISLFSTLEFEIDLDLSLLIAYGGSAQLSSLRSVFRNLPSLKYTSDPLNMDHEVLYSKMQLAKLEFKVQQLTIKNFNFQDGMIGRFSGEISNQMTATELLKEYQANVVKTTYQIMIDQESILVQILPNGCLKLLCEEDDFEYTLNYLKQLIF